MSHLTETLAEFDKEFACRDHSLTEAAEADRLGKTLLYKDEGDMIRAFITSRYKDLEERIEGLRRGEFGIEGTPFYGSLEARKQSRVHNEVLDQVLSIIRDNH